MRWEVVDTDYQVGDVVEFNDRGQSWMGEIQVVDSHCGRLKVYAIEDENRAMHYVWPNNIVRKVHLGVDFQGSIS